MWFPSLRARVTAGLAAMVATLVIVSAVAVVSLDRLGSAIATILRENYHSVIACEDMKEALERQDSASLFAAAGHDDIARPMLAANRAGFTRAFELERRNVTLPGEDELVRRIDVEYRAYAAAVDRVLAEPPGARRTAAYLGELRPRFAALADAVQRVLRMNQAAMEDADRAAKRAARRSVGVALGVSAAAILFALWFAWRLPRTVVRPVRRLADAARAAGGGDLDVAVGEPGVSELAPLADAFRRMLAQLRAYRESSLGELLAAQDLANATVECLVDPVVVLGPGEGEVLLTNAAAANTFGLRAGSADELRAADVAVPDEFARARREVVATGRPIASRNLRDAMRWHDARSAERFFLVRAAPLAPGAGGAPGRVIVVAQDVTRLRRIDDLKSDMVATVSHEFKTPLTSLRMATHLLLEPSTGPLNDAQREVVTTARDDTERLRALVDELLDLVRIEAEAGALHRVPIDLRRLLADVAEAHRTIARDKGVALELAEGPPIAPIALDPERISIVVANLVSNAIRHTPAGGRVVLGATDGAQAARVTVRDTGEGIARDAVARLFDRDAGRRATTGGGRHGLGLMIAQEIALQHGGEIQVQSAVGEGSVFTVALPRAQA